MKLKQKEKRGEETTRPKRNTDTDKVVQIYSNKRERDNDENWHKESKKIETRNAGLIFSNSNVSNDKQGWLIW